MAKKQTRRSISVSRTTYERLKAFCEANNVSMSQFVETRVGDFLSVNEGPAVPSPRPFMATAAAMMPPRQIPPIAPRSEPPRPIAPPPPVPMTSAAARIAVEPPPPIIKRAPERSDQAAPKPAEKRPDQIFTF
jgi:hypothetical protein